MKRQTLLDLTKEVSEATRSMELAARRYEDHKDNEKWLTYVRATRTLSEKAETLQKATDEYRDENGMMPGYIEMNVRTL